MTRVKEHTRVVKGKRVHVKPYYRKEITNNFIAERLKEPSFYDPYSFRRIKKGKALITIACPIGEFKKGKCTVPMEAQSIWREK